jgi:hypothetical protein
MTEDHLYLAWTFLVILPPVLQYMTGPTYKKTIKELRDDT